MISPPDQRSDIELVEAKTQADSVIMYEVVNGLCDAPLSNDGDFAMLGGKKCLQIRI